MPAKTFRDISAIHDGRWQPDRSGDYATDCAAGREIGAEVADLISSTGNPAFFGTIARAIAEAGQFDGIEAGFCSHIGILICVNGPHAADGFATMTPPATR
jgi:hypothetical protein